MKYMDRLPTVISCCFCCFLRAGTIMIALFSFAWGLALAPNVAHARGPWDLEPVLSAHGAATERGVQVLLGALSAALCAASVLLLVGACCNLPALLELYQWAALLYGGAVALLLLVLVAFCFFVHTNCVVAGLVLLALLVLILLTAAYFVVVVNSLRMSMKYLASDDLV